MTTKTTYRCACPITGEKAKRTSAHPYTHSVTVIAKRMFDYDKDAPSITVKTRNQTLPDGYAVVQQPGRASYGWATKLIPLPTDQQVEVVEFLGTFHHSEELARATGRTWLAHRPALVAVRIVAVPCTAE